MDIKRFIGPDMRSALRMVREQLGADAVILSNRRVAQGIEITAGPGADFGAPAAPPAEAVARKAAPTRLVPAVASGARPVALLPEGTETRPVRPVPAAPPALDAVQV
ncbi:MAG: flagellar biosynthesis protein FlhF, partial [Gammaproteobacteria bacterium]